MATTLVRVSARLAATSPSTGVIAPPRRSTQVLQVDRLMTLIMQHAGLRAECMLTMVSTASSTSALQNGAFGAV